MEMVRNSGTMSDGPKPQNHPTLQPTASIPQLPLKLAVLPPSTVPIGRFPPPSTAQPSPLSVLPHPLYFLSIKSRKGEEVWRRGGSRNIPESLEMLRKTKVSRQPWIGVPVRANEWPSGGHVRAGHPLLRSRKLLINVLEFQFPEVRKPL